MSTADELLKAMPRHLQFEGKKYYLELYAIEPMKGNNWMACYYNQETDFTPYNFYEHGATAAQALERLSTTVKLLDLAAT